jgi:hypothetical protein
VDYIEPIQSKVKFHTSFSIEIILNTKFNRNLLRTEVSMMQFKNKQIRSFRVICAKES